MSQSSTAPTTAAATSKDFSDPEPGVATNCFQIECTTSKMRFTNNRLTNLLVCFKKLDNKKCELQTFMTNIHVRLKNKTFAGNKCTFIYN